MAIRPVFIVGTTENVLVQEILLSFQWHPGFSTSQKQKSILSLHTAARSHSIDRVLEISTKSTSPLGIQLSAFNLHLNTNERRVSVESAFQGSKVFAHGGPYTDLYDAPSTEAKKDPRLRGSGQLTEFNYHGMPWPAEPKTAFYDWLYIQALHQALHSNRTLAKQVLSYNAFTDIEFNPGKSLNCQARAAALYVALSRTNRLLGLLESPEEFRSMERRLNRHSQIPCNWALPTHAVDERS